jgi:RNA polymerase sigma factor (TIGR02999 family)
VVLSTIEAPISDFCYPVYLNLLVIRSHPTLTGIVDTVNTTDQNVTRLLQNLDLADRFRADEFLAHVYGELRALASRHMQREQAAHTLQPTALVHEAYLRLVGGQKIDWESRAHFFGIAARAMRQVLVDHARKRETAKRGGGLNRVTLHSNILADSADGSDIMDLHAALERLTTLDPQLSQLVEVRFFAGLTLDEAAVALGVSRRKVAKDWSVARLWLSRELNGQ